MNANQPTTESRERRTLASSRLVFPHGVANLTIRVDPAMAESYRGSFYGPKPTVTEEGGVVSIDYPRFNPMIWGRTSADIAISPVTTWAVEIHGGVSHWESDLRQVDLTGVDVEGGLSHVNVQLGRPRGAVRLHVSGGASSLTLTRPAEVPARLQIGGGASKLALDDQVLGAVGGPIALETSGYSSGADRYLIEIGGGASKITVGRA